LRPLDTLISIAVVSAAALVVATACSGGCTYAAGTSHPDLERFGMGSDALGAGVADQRGLDDDPASDAAIEDEPDLLQGDLADTDGNRTLLSCHDVFRFSPDPIDFSCVDMPPSVVFFTFQNLSGQDVWVTSETIAGPMPADFTRYDTGKIPYKVAPRVVVAINLGFLGGAGLRQAVFEVEFETATGYGSCSVNMSAIGANQCP
jgi:hypothetical protein